MLAALGTLMFWLSMILVSMTIFPFEFVNLIAFDRKFKRIYRYLLSSPEISIK